MYRVMDKYPKTENLRKHDRSLLVEKRERRLVAPVSVRYGMPPNLEVKAR